MIFEQFIDSVPCLISAWAKNVLALTQIIQSQSLDWLKFLLVAGKSLPSLSAIIYHLMQKLLL
jgi:hypothetical protein